MVRFSESGSNEHTKLTTDGEIGPLKVSSSENFNFKCAEK